MGRFHGYVPKMHPIYLCAGTASHIGDFSDYACYVAVLFLPDRVSGHEIAEKRRCPYFGHNIPAQPPHRPPEHAAHRNCIPKPSVPTIEQQRTLLCFNFTFHRVSIAPLSYHFHKIINKNKRELSVFFICKT